MNALFRKDGLSIILTFVLGSIFHFLYDFSGQNPFTALISPVNESVWEHLKLLLFPLLLVSVIESYIRRPNKTAFFGSRLAGAWAGMAVIVCLFYSYTALLGKDFLPLDILIFFAAVSISFFVSSHSVELFRRADSITVFLGWFISILLFFIFTCFPPEIPLFLESSPRISN